MIDNDVFPEIDGYEITSLLGEGGMGKVYLAKRFSDERQVAIKVVHPKHSGEMARQCLNRFIREIQVSKGLYHPSIILILDGGGLDGTECPYIVMELLEGEPLDEAARDNPLSEEQCLNVARQTSSALSYIHEKGLVHRDIKPGNVFLEKEGRVILLDFGLVLDTNRTRMTQTGVLVGTMLTLAPEVLRDEGTNATSDVYSLGVTLYYAATGRWPYSKTEILLLANDMVLDLPPSPSTIRDDFSTTFSKVIMKAFAKEANDRYQNGQELLAALEALEKPITITEDGFVGIETKTNTDVHEKTKRRSPYLPLFLLLISLFFLLCLQPQKTIKTPQGNSKIITSSDLALLRDSLLNSKEEISAEDASTIGFMVRRSGIPEGYLIPIEDDDEIVGLRYLAEFSARKKNYDRSTQTYLTLLERRGPYASVEKFNLSSSTICERTILYSSEAKKTHLLLSWLDEFRNETSSFDSEWCDTTQYWLGRTLIHMSYGQKTFQKINYAKRALGLLEELVKKENFKTEYFRLYCKILAELSEMELITQKLPFVEKCFERRPKGVDEAKMHLACGSMLVYKSVLQAELMLKHHAARAIAHLERARLLSKGNDLLSACRYLARAYCITTQFDKAIETINSINPNSLHQKELCSFFMSKVDVYCSCQKFNEAFEVINKAKQVVPHEDIAAIRTKERQTRLLKLAAGR